MMLNITSSLYHTWMAFVNLADFYSSFVVFQANGEGVLISFPSSSDGMAIVTTIA